MMETKEYKAYEYKTIMKTTYLWLPVFSVVIFICASFEKLRFFLFLTVGAATYGSILAKLKKKATLITFSKNNLTINNKEIKISDIENYYTCLPLNELFMLRIKTNKGKEVLYIEKELKEHIENLMNEYQIPIKKINNDIWLKYSHLKFIFLYMFICFIIFIIYKQLKYSIL